MTDETILDAYLDGEMDPAERAAFEARLAAEPAIRAALDSRRALDGELKEAYGHVRGSHRGEPSGNFRLPPPKRRVPMFLVPLAAAAGIAGGLLIAWEREPPRKEPLAVVGIVAHRTPRVVGFLSLALGQTFDNDGKSMAAGRPILDGDVVRTTTTGRATVVLSDGTEVRLDHDASVHFPGGRRVDVSRGRIWSRVAPGDPFLLGAGGTSVTVLGTELSLRRGDDSTEVQLYSGRAHVEAGGVSRELAPGQEAEFAGGRLSEVRRIGSEAIATGWMLELVAHSGGHDRELAEHLDRLLVDMGHTKAVMIEERALVEDLGGSCRIPLARYLVSDGAQVDLEPRRKAARVLARIADGSVARELARALRDPDPEVRVSAAAALARVSEGKICSMPDGFRASCDDGAAKAAEEWAGTQVTPK